MVVASKLILSSEEDIELILSYLFIIDSVKDYFCKKLNQFESWIKKAWIGGVLFLFYLVIYLYMFTGLRAKHLDENIDLSPWANEEKNRHDEN